MRYQWPNEGVQNHFDVSSLHAPPVSSPATTTWAGRHTQLPLLKVISTSSTPPVFPVSSSSLSSKPPRRPVSPSPPSCSLCTTASSLFVVVAQPPSPHSLRRGCSPSPSQYSTATGPSMIFQPRQAPLDLLPLSHIRSPATPRPRPSSRIPAARPPSPCRHLTARCLRRWPWLPSSRCPDPKGRP